MRAYQILYRTLLPVRPIYIDDGSRWRDPLSGWLAVARLRAQAENVEWSARELERIIAEVWEEVGARAVSKMDMGYTWD